MRFHRLLILLMALAAGLTLTAAVAQESTLASRLQAVEQVYRTEGPTGALPQFQELLTEARQTGDEASRAVALRFVGECYWRMGQFDASREHLESAISASSILGDAMTEAKTHNVLGLLEWDIGDYDAALARFESAADLAVSMDDPRLQGAILNNTSLVYDELGEYERSLEGYQQVLALYALVDFPRGEGDTLGNIGGVNLLLGRFNEAIDYYRQALVVSESLESAAAMSQDHGNLGFGYDGLGQIEQSIEQFDRALELAQGAGLAQEEAYWLRGKANAEIRVGRYDLGLQHHRKALEIYRGQGDNAPLVDALHDMGRLMLELGDPISAQSYFDQAMSLAQEMGRARSVTLNQLALGDLKLRQRQLIEAESLYREALHRAGEAGEYDLIAGAYLSLARLQLERQDYAAALDLAQSALDAMDVYPDQPQVVAATLVRGTALLEQEKPGQAQTTFEHSLKLAGETSDPDLLWQAEYGRGRALERQGEKQEAVAGFARAVAHIESVRSLLREKRFRSGYLQDKHQVYTDLIRLQLELGRDSDAFDTSEQLRTFSFIQQSAPLLPRPRAQRQVNDVRARIRQLQRAIDEERAWPPAEQRQRALQTFSSELLAAEQSYQALLDDQSAQEQTREQGLAMADVRTRLQSGEALLNYIVGPDNVMLFVLTRADVHTLVVPVERASLRRRIELLRDLVQQASGDRWTAPSARLAASLLQPALASGWLDEINRLYLVPHGELHYLPFAMLMVEEKSQPGVLVERFELAYLPSASALPVRDHAVGETRVLTVAPARSRLQHAPEEARAIAGIFAPHSQSLNGAAATETAFRQLAMNFGVIHLATHGYFNHMNPMLSGLELEADQRNDGLLEVHEIMQMRLQADLVTLSACETGLGSGFFNEIPAGDEFVGLTRAFLQAGSTSILATLWQVDDRSTLQLMKDFYTRLEEAGGYGDKAVALARAQRALLASNDYRHPYYWASFMLVGAGKTNATIES